MKIIYLTLYAVALYNFDLTWFIISVMIGWLLSGIAVSCIYHRKISHNLWQPKNKIINFFCNFCLIASGQGSPLSWAYVHRLHHKYTDKDKDPQSPIVNGKFATLFSHYKIAYPEIRIIRDLLNNKEVMFLHKNYNKLSLIYFFLLIIVDPIIACYLVGGGFFWCATLVGILNTYAHKIESNIPCSITLPSPILFWGENYHALHHKSPYILNLGKFDIGFTFIKFLRY